MSASWIFFLTIHWSKERVFHKGPDEHMDPGEEDCGGTGMDFRFEKGGKKTTFLTYVK